MDKKLRAARIQGPREPPGICFGDEHLYPGSLVALTKPWATGVTDVDPLVPRHIASV